MNLAGSTFHAVSNSSSGALNTETTMTFQSDDEMGILGTYRGGTIRAGNVIAIRKDDVTIDMLYHCVTVSGELKAGRAVGKFAEDAEKRWRMRLNWQWLTGDCTKGRSEWVLGT
jgi:hypothetical protein